MTAMLAATTTATDTATVAVAAAVAATAMRQPGLPVSQPTNHPSANRFLRAVLTIPLERRLDRRHLSRGATGQQLRRPVSNDDIFLVHQHLAIMNLHAGFQGHDRALAHNGLIPFD